MQGWLQARGLAGYMRVADVEARPKAEEIIKHIDANQITNKQVCRFLNLKNEGYNVMHTLDIDVLQSYFGEYSLSSKSYLTVGGLDVLSHDVAKFLFEAAFLSSKHYLMPKQKAWLIIVAYETVTVDWGYVTVDGG